MSKLLPLVLLPFLTTVASVQTRTQDVVYMKTGGMAFTMDVLKPAKPNKAAVVFVVSGGWYSDDSMLKRYEPDIEKVFVDAGFTVFEVLHAQPVQGRRDRGTSQTAVRSCTRMQPTTESIRTGWE
jgi:hypothetical protein